MAEENDQRLDINVRNVAPITERSGKAMLCQTGKYNKRYLRCRKYVAIAKGGGSFLQNG